VLPTFVLLTASMFEINFFFCKVCLILTMTMHLTGLAMFCCMPTTLSSGVTLTQLVGGNSALALTMTVVSNLLGIIIVPLSLAMYIGAGAGVSLPTEQLFKSLVTRLLIPLIIGKCKPKITGASWRDL
jgi:predicted Na+-dependent transporter